MRRGLQEGFDITKLVGVLTFAAFATVALAGIEDGSDPTGPVGVKGSRIERAAGLDGAAVTITNLDPTPATGDDAGCTQQQCDLTCAVWFPSPCTVTNAACFTNPVVGHAQCSCAHICPGGTVAPSKYKTCAVQQDSSDGR